MSVGQLQVGNDFSGAYSDGQLGYTLCLSADGNKIAIGTWGADNNGVNSGQVQIWEWNSVSWNMMGTPIDGDAAGDSLGNALSFSSNGNWVAIGAKWNDGNGEDAGQVRVFEWNDTVWDQMGSDLYGKAEGDEFGYSCTLSGNGNRLAVGAIFHSETGSEAGQVTVNEWDGNQWIQIGASINGTVPFIQFGWKTMLSADGNRLAISAIFSNENGSDAGQVRIYDWDGENWMQLGSSLNGSTAGGRSYSQ